MNNLGFHLLRLILSCADLSVELMLVCKKWEKILEKYWNLNHVKSNLINFNQDCLNDASVRRFIWGKLLSGYHFGAFDLLIFTSFHNRKCLDVLPEEETLSLYHIYQSFPKNRSWIDYLDDSKYKNKLLQKFEDRIDKIRRNNVCSICGKYKYIQIAEHGPGEDAHYCCYQDKYKLQYKPGLGHDYEFHYDEEDSPNFPEVIKLDKNNLHLRYKENNDDQNKPKYHKIKRKRSQKNQKRPKKIKYHRFN